MRWPWRHHDKDDEAGQAQSDADEQARLAGELATHVERTARQARELARGADRFARDIERSMRRGPA
jgi:hypothetical protein